MDRRESLRGRSWAAVVAAVVVLAGAAPQPGAALDQLTVVSSATDPFAPFVAAVSLVAWAAALWLALSVLVTVAGDCPGWTGRIGRALSRRLVPAAMRRTLQLSLGLTVAVSALGATTASASAPLPPAPSSSAAQSAGPGGPSLDWPTVRAGAPSPAPVSPSSAAPTSISSPSAGAGAQAAAGEPAPAAATPSAALPVPMTGMATVSPEQDRSHLPATPATPGRPAPAAASGGSVLVRPGDSLWSISRAHLQAAGADAAPADVARAWPQWWEANRQLVGDDPDLVLPGAQLTPP